MRKRIVLLLSLTMVLMMSAVAFAADQEPIMTEDPIEEYTSVLKNISIIKESDDGHTYGSGMCTELGMKCPDFIAAIGESGIEGYVKSKDLEISDETGASIIEMEPGDVNLSFIPLYSESGKIIGKFKLETRCYAVEDGGNTK